MGHRPNARQLIAYCYGATTTEINAQVAEVESFARDAPVTLYREVRRAGQTPGRAFAQALSAARASGSTLAFTSLGDLAQQPDCLERLLDARVSLLVLDDNAANAAALPWLIRAAHAHTAQSARIKRALAEKRNALASLSKEEQDQWADQGKRLKLGGKPVDDAGRLQSAKTRRTEADARLEIVTAEVKKLRIAGVVENADIAQALNHAGISRPRGGLWTGVHVSRVTSKLKRGSGKVES